MGEISLTPLAQIAEIQQGRYLAKEDMSEIRSSATPAPVHGANGIIGWTRAPMYQKGLPLVTCRGSNSGMILWADGPLWVSNNAMAISPINGDDQFDTKFLYYALLLNPPFGVVTGSAQPQITRRDLSTHLVFWADRANRQAIASFFGALDDKIDLNRRMNETLEAMALAIFKDWFVDFGPTVAKMEGGAPYLAPEIWALFPDRLDNQGKPEGWRFTNIASVGRVVTGKTPSTADPDNFGGEYPFITIPDLDGRIYITDVERTISEKGALLIKGALLPRNSVMMSCIATVGRCGITTKLCFTNQQINTVICEPDIAPEYLYWVFRNLVDRVEQAGGGGSVYTNVSKSRFSAINVLVPPIKVQREFVGPWFEKAKANAEEIASLSTTRDLLLPKLMSGEIRVKDAKKKVQAVA